MTEQRRPLHWSHLRNMARSPAHYRYNLDHPQEPTDAMRLGTLVHHIALVTPTRYRIWAGGRRAGKEWNEFQSETAAMGVEIVRQPSMRFYKTRDLRSKKTEQETEQETDNGSGSEGAARGAA